MIFYLYEQKLKNPGASKCFFMGILGNYLLTRINSEEGSSLIFLLICDAYEFLIIFRADYNEKKKSLQEKMTEFRNEIESLKVVDRQSEHDRIHATNLQMGIDKYSTLRKVTFFTSRERKHTILT